MITATFKRGVHPSYHKELACQKTIEKALLPKRVSIPLRQHLGAPCEPLVKKNDTVVEGQKIGEAKGFVSAPVHASISGKVSEIEVLPYPGGGRCLTIVIEGDGACKDWALVEGGLDIAQLSRDWIRGAVREAGIVGMGGAAFPTAVKLSPPKDRPVDTVILNGCECEPYLTADHRLMVESADKVILGLKAIMKAVEAKEAYIGIEDNKPDAIEALSGSVKRLANHIKIVPLETKYPQGAEKMLIAAILGRKVPIGKLPYDVGVLVNNVGTAVAVHDVLAYGKPLIERVVTISGNGIKEQKNLIVRIGASFEDVISQCGGIVDGKEKVVINGGPMMGVTQTFLGVPVVKGTSGITILTADEIKPLKYDPCIRCASCVEACPMGLMPYRIADMGRLSMATEFKDWDGLSCIECGCCSFVCPSKRLLVQWIRVGKIRVREADLKASAV
ncbi:MAG: electron transport complex subunit RsxC [Deltaproteobacteria bacterium]|nr:electron transport complex subunit RsxC [Deltaproteobacteria bacterium]